MGVSRRLSSWAGRAERGLGGPGTSGVPRAAAALRPARGGSQVSAWRSARLAARGALRPVLRQLFGSLNFGHLQPDTVAPSRSGKCLLGPKSKRSGRPGEGTQGRDGCGWRGGTDTWDGGWAVLAQDLGVGRISSEEESASRSRRGEKSGKTSCSGGSGVCPCCPSHMGAGKAPCVCGPRAGKEVLQFSWVLAPRPPPFPCPLLRRTMHSLPVATPFLLPGLWGTLVVRHMKKLCRKCGHDVCLGRRYLGPFN